MDGDDIIPALVVVFVVLVLLGVFVNETVVESPYVACVEDCVNSIDSKKSLCIEACNKIDRNCLQGDD